MKPRAHTLTRRRWCQTAALWALGVGVISKGLTSLTRQERKQLENGLANMDKSLDEFMAELKQPSNNATEPSSPQPPQPSLQELHPEYYQGDYAQFLNHSSLRYINTHEVITPHRRIRNGVSNDLPPKALWHNITETLHVADEVRHRLGTPLSYITSAYRTPDYNRQCGGASRSYHTKNNALDLVYEQGSDAAFELALQLREEGFFQGGIGYYPGFIHIDTRGYKATWEA